MPARLDKKPPRRHTPEVWAMVRQAYCGGATAAECHARFGVEEGALRARAQRHGWTKKAAWAEGQAALDGVPPPTGLNVEDPVSIAEAGLRRAAEAMAAGKSGDAHAHIRAATAVGEFAEVVKVLRGRRG